MADIVFDVSEIISEEIHKFEISQPTYRGTIKPLGFPSRINGICKSKSVDITTRPLRKLKLPLNKAYIRAHYTNSLDEVQGPEPQLQPHPKSSLYSYNQQ